MRDVEREKEREVEREPDCALRAADRERKRVRDGETKILASRVGATIPLSSISRLVGRNRN